MRMSDLFASYWVVVLNGAEPRWRCLVQRLPLLSGYIAFVEHTYSTYILVHFNVLAKWTSSWPHSDKVQGEGRSIYADCIMGGPSE